MDRFIALIDGTTAQIARIVRWLALAMVLVQFAIVVGRYVFGVNSIAVQELVLYMHATFFMLGAAYTLQVDRHVRVDIFYSRWRPAAQRRVEIFGHVCLLLPAMAALAYWSWPSVRNSWAILEGPISVGGLQAVFLLKTLIPVFAVTLMLQSMALLARLLLRPAR